MALRILQLREETTERLREILAEAKKKRFDYKMRIATGEGVNPHEARDMRIEIARIKTMLRAIDLVAERANVNAAGARSALESNRWDMGRAAASLGAATPAGPEGPPSPETSGEPLGDAEK